jgi:hypothetical protein
MRRTIYTTLVLAHSRSFLVIVESVQYLLLALSFCAGWSIQYSAYAECEL